MSLETALARALHRHLELQHQFAVRHYVRSGIVAYWHRAMQLRDQASKVSVNCNYVVL